MTPRPPSEERLASELAAEIWKRWFAHMSHPRPVTQPGLSIADQIAFHEIAVPMIADKLAAALADGERWRKFCELAQPENYDGLALGWDNGDNSYAVGRVHRWDRIIARGPTCDAAIDAARAGQGGSEG